VFSNEEKMDFATYSINSGSSTTIPQLPIALIPRGLVGGEGDVQHLTVSSLKQRMLNVQYWEILTFPLWFFGSDSVGLWFSWSDEELLLACSCPFSGASSSSILLFECPFSTAFLTISTCWTPCVTSSAISTAAWPPSVVFAKVNFLKKKVLRTYLYSGRHLEIESEILFLLYKLQIGMIFTLVWSLSIFNTYLKESTQAIVDKKNVHFRECKTLLNIKTASVSIF